MAREKRKPPKKRESLFGRFKKAVQPFLASLFNSLFCINIE